MQSNQQLIPSTVHFIVLSHGNNGQHQDVEYLEEQIRTSFNEKENESSLLFTLRTRSNSKDTHHGIAEGGKRMAKEIIEYFDSEVLNKLSIDQKVKFSLIGHSLGGLYCRYAAFVLMNDYEEKYFTYFEPCGLTTICSPHLGSKRTSSGWSDVYGKAVSGVANTYLNYFLGETGKQLALIDPLLFEMSEPNSKYIQAWNIFKFKTIIGCTYMDISVPHSGACITSKGYTNLPKKQSPIEFSIVGHSGFDSDENYQHLFAKDTELIFQVENLDENSSEFIPDSNNQQLISPKMVNNLQKHVNCRRVHIQFTYPSLYHSFNGYVHDLVINKVKPHYWINENEQAALNCVKMIVGILLTDHTLQ